MAKSKKTNKGSHGKKSKNVEMVEESAAVSGNAQQEEKEEITVVPPDNYIFVCIDSITNIRSKLLSQTSSIKFRVQFGKDFVTDSPLISFSDTAERETEVKWKASIPCYTSQTGNLDFLTANPVLLSIAEDDRKVIEDQVQAELSNPPKEVEFKPFAYCTLDLLPLILGETEIRQTLILEIDQKPKVGKGLGKVKGGAVSKKEKASKKESASKSKSDSTKSKGKSSKEKGSSKSEKSKAATVKSGNTANNTIVPIVVEAAPSVAQLPFISIQASVQKLIVSREIVEESNLIFLTVESIYNLPQNFDGESMQFEVASLIPTEFDKEQVIHFGQGFLKKESDRERTKRWINIDEFPGKSSHTQYTISEDLFPVKNKIGVDLCHDMSADAPRIEWNKLRRSWLSSSNSEYLGEYLSKTKTWLLEIMIAPKDSGKKKNPKSKGEAPVAGESMHFAAFVDVGTIMYPGMHSVRVASQLFTYCKDEIEGKCGARSKTIFLPHAVTKPQEIRSKTKGKKEKSIKDKKGGKSDGKSKSTGSKKDSKATSKTQSTVAPLLAAVEETPEIIEPCVAKPWINEEGKPVFVIFELELMRPLTAKISDEELFAKIDKLIPQKPQIPIREMAAKKAGKEHADLIKQLTKRLTTEYRDFVSQRKNSNLPLNTGNQHTRDFYQFLKEKDVIPLIKRQLSKSLDALVKDKLGYNMASEAEQDSKAKHKFVSNLYVRLFEEVNTIINTFQDTTVENAQAHELSQSQLSRLEMEARTLGLSSLQRYHFLQKKTRSEADVGTQIFYASQCDDLETALEYALGLLVTDRNLKEGLALYAILLTKKGDFENAQLFFEEATSKHPEYLIGGYLYSLFYQMIGNTEGAQVVWERTRKYTAKSHGKYDDILRSSYPQFLDWDPQMYQPDSMHLRNTELLFYVRKFSLEFIYLALEQELKEHGSSEPYFYYLSICHYRSQRYQEACMILESILVEKPRINHIRRLLGHCQYEMGLREKAMQNYQFVVDNSKEGFANHLVHLRLGEYYLELEDYQAAKDVYFESCVCTPTANSWLGVGIACYMQEDYWESEKALTEANFLDRTVAKVWGYLALVNLRLFREDIFEQCYCRAIRYNLNDDKVMGMIKELAYACGFTEPNLIHVKHTECVYSNK